LKVHTALRANEPGKVAAFALPSFAMAVRPLFITFRLLVIAVHPLFIAVHPRFIAVHQLLIAVPPFIAVHLLFMARTRAVSAVGLSRSQSDDMCVAPSAALVARAEQKGTGALLRRSALKAGCDSRAEQGRSIRCPARQKELNGPPPRRFSLKSSLWLKESSESFIRQYR